MSGIASVWSIVHKPKQRVEGHDPRVKFVETMIGCVQPTGAITIEEHDCLLSIIRSHPVFTSDEPNFHARCLAKAVRAWSDGISLYERAETISRSLPSRAERLIAYSLGADAWMISRGTTGKGAGEDGLVALAWSFGLHKDEVTEIRQASVKTATQQWVEQKIQKLTDQLPSFLDALALMSLADGDAGPGEQQLIEAVVTDLADARAIEKSALLKLITTAFDRVHMNDESDLLVSIARGIAERQDRHWLAVYLRMVMAADGIEHPNEQAFLGRILDRFELDRFEREETIRVALELRQERTTVPPAPL